MKPAPVVLIVLAALLLLGLLGKVTTAGYHCHYVHIGDTVACE